VRWVHCDFTAESVLSAPELTIQCDDESCRSRIPSLKLAAPKIANLKTHISNLLAIGRTYVRHITSCYLCSFAATNLTAPQSWHRYATTSNIFFCFVFGVPKSDISGEPSTQYSGRNWLLCDEIVNPACMRVLHSEHDGIRILILRIPATAPSPSACDIHLGRVHLTSAVHLQNGASLPHGLRSRCPPFCQVQPLVSQQQPDAGEEQLRSRDERAGTTEVARSSRGYLPRKTERVHHRAGSDVRSVSRRSTGEGLTAAGDWKA